MTPTIAPSIRIGQDYGRFGDSFLVHLSNATSPGSKHLLLNQTLPPSREERQSSPSGFKTSTVTHRHVDLTPYLDHKVVLEFVVVDVDDQAVDVSLPN